MLVIKITCAALLLAIMFFMFDSFVVMDDENYPLLKAVQRVFRNFCIIVVCIGAFIGIIFVFGR